MITNYFKNLMIDIIASGASVSAYSNTTIALSSTKPDVYGGNLTEPSATENPEYKRAYMYHHDNHIQAMSKATDGKSTNTQTIMFPEALTDWGELRYYAIFINSSMVAFGELKNPIHPVDGTVPLIRVGELDFEFIEQEVVQE